MEQALKWQVMVNIHLASVLNGIVTVVNVDVNPDYQAGVQIGMTEVLLQDGMIM